MSYIDNWPIELFLEWPITSAKKMIRGRDQHALSLRLICVRDISWLMEVGIDERIVPRWISVLLDLWAHCSRPTIWNVDGTALWHCLSTYYRSIESRMSTYHLGALEGVIIQAAMKGTYHAGTPGTAAFHSLGVSTSNICVHAMSDSRRSRPEHRILPACVPELAVLLLWCPESRYRYLKRQFS